MVNILPSRILVQASCSWCGSGKTTSPKLHPTGTSGRKKVWAHGHSARLWHLACEPGLGHQFGAFLFSSIDEITSYPMSFFLFLLWKITYWNTWLWLKDQFKTQKLFMLSCFVLLANCSLVRNKKTWKYSSSILGEPLARETLTSITNRKVCGFFNSKNGKIKVI